MATAIQDTLFNLGDYPHQRLPKTDAIDIPFEWLSVDYVMSLPSADFYAEGLTTEENRDSKRSDSQYRNLKSSIREFGFTDPIYVYRQHESGYTGREKLGNGHHRVVAAHDLGYTHIPVTRDDDYQWESSASTKVGYY